jgi:hypothetical protein
VFDKRFVGLVEKIRRRRSDQGLERVDVVEIEMRSRKESGESK